MTNVVRNALMLRSCYLYYQEQLNIKDIAEQLGISRFRVSRFLKEAIESGVVQVQFLDPSMQSQQLAMEVGKAYGLRRVLIAPTPENADMESRRRAIGQVGGELFAELPPETVIGVTWGRTIAYMVDSVPAEKYQARRVVELAGAFGQITSSVAARVVALKLAEKLRAECVQLTAPIIADTRQSAEMLLGESSIRQTLKMAEQSDVAIVGVGPMDLDSLLYKSGYLTKDDFDRLRAANAVGAIMGRFFDIDGAPVNAGLWDRVVGLNFEQFLNVPERIALAAGRLKLDSIVGLANGGLITTLVTDFDTATALMERLQTT